MRSGKFSVTGNTDRDGIIPLAVADVSVDSRDDPRIVTIHLRRRKTDQYARGEYLYLGRTYDSLCPVSAILAYLAVCPPSPGPLFLRMALPFHSEDSYQVCGRHSLKQGSAQLDMLATVFVLEQQQLLRPLA